MKQPGEVIDGKRLIDTISALIESRRLCKMVIPNTSYGLITLLLGFQKQGNSQYLLIDYEPGFEKTFSKLTNPEVSLEFLEKDGVPCQFKTRVIKIHPTALFAEIPKSIYRMQRRRHFRIKARSGTEIVFHLSQTVKGMGIVKDYSLGGVAFFMEGSIKIDVGDYIDKIELRITQGNQQISFQIPKAIVRRRERGLSEKDQCGLEFLEMAKETIDPLWRHIFKEQRMLLRRIKKD